MVSKQALAAGAFALAALGAAASAAHAEATAADRETARTLMDKGDAAFERKDLADALRLYRGADAIMHVPTTAFEVAKTLLALGKLVEARDVALAIVRSPVQYPEPAAFAKARADAAGLAAAVEPRISGLVIMRKGLPGATIATVRVDGEAQPPEAASLPRRVDPGKHVITGSASGYADVTREVDVAEGTTARVELRFDRAPGGAEPQAQAGRYPLTWIAFGVGSAGIVAGSVTGVMSLSRASAAKSYCNGDACNQAGKHDADASLVLANVSNACFAVGAVGLIVAGILYFSRPSSAVSSSAPLTRPTVFVGRSSALLGYESRF